MDTLNLVSNGSPHRPGWMDFCDKHAKTVSEEFFASFLVYLKAHPTSEYRPNEPIDFAKKFVDLFIKYFEKKLFDEKFIDTVETENCQPEGAVGWSSCSPHSTSGRCDFSTSSNGYNGPGAIDDLFQTSSGHDNFGDSSDHFHSNSHALTSDVHSPNSSQSTSSIKHKGSILKRFSFRKIKQRNLFKQNSDEIELATGSNENYSRERQLLDQKQMKRSKKHLKDSKHKLPVLLHPGGEVKKEGIVHVFNGEDAKGKNKWEKTRLVLYKTDKDYSLEFFSPPKVN